MASLGTDKFLKNGEVEIHYVEAGPPEGHLVVLLHGFPSFWYTWKYQIGPLAERGFHVVAPDLRGYNLSSKPEAISAYGREPLLADVTAVLDQCGQPGAKATLVGHDWGGNIAWAFAHEHPERLARLIILNMPHPAAFSQALRSSIGQMRRSWYIFMFQLPYLGERMLSSDNFKGLRNVYREDPVKDQGEEDAQLHVDAFSRPGALTAAINYYRAIFLYWWGSPPKHAKVEIPVLFLWGEKEKYFEPYLADLPKEQVPNATVVKLPEASHWVMWDEAEKVNGHMLEFLASPSKATDTPDSKL